MFGIRQVTSFAVRNARSKHTLPDLPYDYAALEPIISRDIMNLHHTKHHNTYVTNLNVAEEKLKLAVEKGDVKLDGGTPPSGQQKNKPGQYLTLKKGTQPNLDNLAIEVECKPTNLVNAQISLAPAIRFNGGGHINHSIFWQNLCPGSSQPSSELCKALETSFGGVDNMKKQLSAQTIAIQGSGWGWLGYDKSTGLIRIVTCANQDPLQAISGLVPLLGIDVWEHAYYLQYKNVRADYVNAIFDIVNWKDVSERFKKASTC